MAFSEAFALILDVPARVIQDFPFGKCAAHLCVGLPFFLKSGCIFKSHTVGSGDPHIIKIFPLILAFLSLKKYTE